jgi:hypothetical protein
LLKLLPQPTTEQTAKRAINALAALGVERSKITYDPDEFQLRTDGTAPGWGTCTPIAGWSGPRKGGDNDQAENWSSPDSVDRPAMLPQLRQRVAVRSPSD